MKDFRVKRIRQFLDYLTKRDIHEKFFEIEPNAVRKLLYRLWDRHPPDCLHSLLVGITSEFVIKKLRLFSDDQLLKKQTVIGGYTHDVGNLGRMTFISARGILREDWGGILKEKGIILQPGENPLTKFTLGELYQYLEKTYGDKLHYRSTNWKVVGKEGIKRQIQPYWNMCASDYIKKHETDSKLILPNYGIDDSLDYPDLLRDGTVLWLDTHNHNYENEPVPERLRLSNQLLAVCDQGNAMLHTEGIQRKFNKVESLDSAVEKLIKKGFMPELVYAFGDWYMREYIPKKHILVQE